jgi:hypothetical protein
MACPGGGRSAGGDARKGKVNDYSASNAPTAEIAIEAAGKRRWR